MTIQNEGGTRATIERGLAELRGILKVADKSRRETVSVSEITIGLQCLVAFIAVGHAAAGSMHDGHNAVDVGITVQKPWLLGCFGNKTGY